MRLTVLDDDPGRKINLSKERYSVYLNGVEVKHVFTADDEKGEVIAAVPDERGYMTAENDEVKRHTLYGSVRIEPLLAVIEKGNNNLAGIREIEKLRK
ncbi:hypothetical protein ACQZ6X_002317 [Escherichia coli]